MFQPLVFIPSLEEYEYLQIYPYLLERIQTYIFIICFELILVTTPLIVIFLYEKIDQLFL